MKKNFLVYGSLFSLLIIPFVCSCKTLESPIKDYSIFKYRYEWQPIDEYLSFTRLFGIELKNEQIGEATQFPYEFTFVDRD